MHASAAAFAILAFTSLTAGGQTEHACDAQMTTHVCTQPFAPFTLWYAAGIQPAQPSELGAQLLDSPTSKGCNPCGTGPKATCKQFYFNSNGNAGDVAVRLDALSWPDGKFRACQISCKGYLKVAC